MVDRRIAATTPRVSAVGSADHAAIEQARLLLRAYAASLPFSLAYQDFERELVSLPAPYVPPGGCLLLATEDRPAMPRGTAFGIAGLKPLADGIGEIKRLYVAPEARGRGLGAALLTALIEEAVRLAYRSVRLDSHRTSMGPAIALYRRLGFAEIPPYGPDLSGQIIFFEKPLGRGVETRLA